MAFRSRAGAVVGQLRSCGTQADEALLHGGDDHAAGDGRGGDWRADTTATVGIDDRRGRNRADDAVSATTVRFRRAERVAFAARPPQLAAIRNAVARAFYLR